VRFGVFELDARAGELRRSGRRVALQPQPLEVLRALLERPGEVVTREELRRRVWKNGAYVDFDRSLNKAIVKLRDALGDDADSPRYIETLPRHGYRFIPLPHVHAHVDAAPGEQSALTANMPQPEGPASLQTSPVPGAQSAGRRHSWRWATLGLTLLTLAAWIIWSRVEGPSYTGPPLNVAPAGGVSFAPPPHSIAVLPFVNMSGDPGQEYFSDGLTEELLNSLSRINELQVAARTSSFSFQGEHPDIATVAHKLNVASVLEGSVRRSGHTVRVTAQLNNAVTGFHIWSQTYDRDLGDVLQLQTEIATAVAEALKVKLLGNVAQTMELGGTRNSAAFDAYLRAASAYWGTASDIESARAGYEEAVRLDPNFARAYADLSIALNAYAAFFAHGPAAGDFLRQARATALKAVALAPELAEGHLALALVQQESLDFAGASDEFQRAVTLAPGNARILRDYSTFAVEMGRTEAGIAAARRAVALDPLNVSSHGYLSSALWFARRYDEALTAYQDGLSLGAKGFTGPFVGALIYYALGDFEKTRAQCEAIGEALKNLQENCLALAYHKLGRQADAEAALARFKALDGNAGAYGYATIYAQWGNSAQALEWLTTAVRYRNSDLASVKTDPLLDPLRNDPRFQAIERELKFPN
jgi:TolB-like protein/DNA-binding winged helix-turn-helix (wHTH) protein